MKKFIIASKSSPLARGVAGGTRRGVAKKFIVAITLTLCAFGVRAENETQIATSMGYVAEELETRQDKFQKLGADNAMTYSGTTNGAIGSRAITGNLGAETNTTNTALPTVGAVDTKLDNKQDELDFAANTVLMNTGVAGAPAAKGIYDDSGSYATQTDSLIEAATFNAALQTAINSEFTCAQRKDPNDPTSKCLLFNIFAPTQNLMIPNTYTRLEYLESTGTQYIDTGILPNQNYSMELDFQPTVANQSVFYAATRVHASNKAFTINSGGSGRFLYCSFDGSGNKTIMNWANNSTDHIRVKVSSDKCVGGENSISLTTSNFQATLPLYLFGGNDDGVASLLAQVRIFAFKVWNNGTIVANYIPARRNSDGALGMYDTVSGTFFTNAGTGTFIAGPGLSSNIYLPMD